VFLGFLCLMHPQNIRHILIDKTVVRGEKPALYWSKGEGATFWSAWTEAEAREEQSIS